MKADKSLETSKVGFTEAAETSTVGITTAVITT